MQNYHSIDEISAEIGVSRATLSKKANFLGFDVSKITDARKKRLIKACEPTIERKKEAENFLKETKSVKVGQIEPIVNQTGSTLEQRLIIAKQEFDKVHQSLLECQVAIEKKGTILMNGNNGTISSNPAIKTKCELLKQFNALQKTIQDLEDKLKYTSIPTESSPIDD